MEENAHFVCTTKDCNLRFSSETHLKIHKKKHEMVLSLAKTSITSCNETPTPSTFIRDCEEVGLFQELRNVNPFEETFRKAAEAVRTGAHHPTSLSFSSQAADDTLHTPHVFPSVIEPEPPPKLQVLCVVSPELSVSPVKSGECNERVVRQEADTSLKVTSPHLSGLPVGQTKILSLPVNATDEQNVQVLLRMPDGTYLQLATKPVQAPASNVLEGLTEVRSCVEPIAKPPLSPSSTVILNTQTLPQIQSSPVRTTDSSSIVKQKLKQALLSSKALTGVVRRTSNASLTNQVSNGGSSGNGQRGIKRPASIVRRASTSTNSEEDPNEEKRRKALERNRAAAMRSREKRKAFVAELGRKADAMSATNHTLLQEVASLRAEVTRLKSLLLAHSECPVTLAAIAANNSGGNEVVGGGEVERGGVEVRRSRLSLDIEGARRRAATGELDSPLVRSDEVLSSVAPPTTPNDTDKHIVLNNNGDDSDVEVSEEKPLATPVIQLNPNSSLLRSIMDDVDKWVRAQEIPFGQKLKY